MKIIIMIISIFTLSNFSQAAGFCPASKTLTKKITCMQKNRKLHTVQLFTDSSGKYCGTITVGLDGIEYKTPAPIFNTVLNDDDEKEIYTVVTLVHEPSPCPEYSDAPSKSQKIYISETGKGSSIIESAVHYNSCEITGGGSRRYKLNCVTEDL